LRRHDWGRFYFDRRIHPQELRLAIQEADQDSAAFHTGLHFSRASEFIRISSASNESVSFEKDIYLIFERSCFFCHGPIGTLEDFVLISAVLSSAMTETGR
jgi:hypothetical protein